MENENINEAKEKFEELQNDEIERELAFRRQMAIMDKKAFHDTAYNDGFREGEKKGAKEGEERGEKNASIEIARKMKELNVPLEVITESTGLSIEEIEKL